MYRYVAKLPPLLSVSSCPVHHTASSTLVRVETRLEDILTLRSPCGGQEDYAEQHIEGGVAVVSRMLPSLSPAAAGGMSGFVNRGGAGSEAVTAEQFARGVQDSWRVGKKGCDNGFLLVASREDRSFAIAVVRKLTSTFTFAVGRWCRCTYGCGRLFVVGGFK